MIRFVVLASILVLAGCQREAAQPDQNAFRGQYVYLKNCAPCHDAKNPDLVVAPPPLAGLSKTKSDDEIRDVIQQGRNTMPAFQGMLTNDDINAVVRYIHTR